MSCASEALSPLWLHMKAGRFPSKPRSPFCGGVTAAEAPLFSCGRCRIHNCILMLFCYMMSPNHFLFFFIQKPLLQCYLHLFFVLFFGRCGKDSSLKNSSPLKENRTCHINSVLFFFFGRVFPSECWSLYGSGYANTICVSLCERRGWSKDYEAYSRLRCCQLETALLLGNVESTKTSRGSPRPQSVSNLSNAAMRLELEVGSLEQPPLTNAFFIL